MVLPAGITQVGYLDLESFLEFGTLVEDEFGPEGGEEFLY